MEEEVVKVNDVSMVFSMASDRSYTLKEYFVKGLKGKNTKKVFKALDHVSFSVKKGEVVGLIGHNGAGKSTILKVISGIMTPTSGSVTVKGNVVPLLELGSGFDLDLTGRENIFLNGAILGYSEKYIKDHFKDIVDFSELWDFLDVPLRNYSSGMVMRLAFSIATIVVPDILIVDEIISVGDSDFQQKSFDKMKELMSGGTTVLFVSHSIEQVKDLCDNVVWLESGSLRAFGSSSIVCGQYMDVMAK